MTVGVGRGGRVARPRTPRWRRPRRRRRQSLRGRRARRRCARPRRQLGGAGDVRGAGQGAAAGATLLTRGHRLDGPGYFFAATALTDVPDECRLSAEEIFGPVAPIATFADPDEAVARANDTEHGLVAYLFTNDIRRAFDLIDRLDVGMVAPFGGVKQSGFRREGGPEGIDEYLDTKYVAFGAG